jgi:hypothetical protein
MSPIPPSVKQKKLGLLKRKVKAPDDFNAPLPPEIIASFEGALSVRALLDTHLFLWAVSAPSKLSALPPESKLMQPLGD